MKRQPKNWEKGYVNHTSDEGLASGIQKELSKLNIKTKQNKKKMQQENRQKM